MIRGWPIVGVSAVLVGAVVAGGLLVFGPGESGLRFAIRATARTSLALFLTAFVASALRRTWPGPASRWLLANRRYLGVSFAVSHLVHGLAIAALARAAPHLAVDPVTLVAGGVGYLFIAAMTATSFDRTAAWLGPRRWSWLHTTGLYYVWLVFFATVAPQAARDALHALATLALVAALGLRLHTRRLRTPAVA